MLFQANYATFSGHPYTNVTSDTLPLSVISPMKLQFVLTNTIRHNFRFPALLNCWATNKPSFKILCPQKFASILYFRKNVTSLMIGLSRTVEGPSVSCKILYQWVAINFCFTSLIHKASETAVQLVQSQFLAFTNTIRR